MRPPVDLTGCTFSCAICLIWSASSCSRRLTGSSDETSQPAPKAMSPAASGLPRVFCRAMVGADVAVSPIEEAIDDALSVASPMAPWS